MSRSRFDQMTCSVAQTLDVVGDWWTLLIIRDAFLGSRYFAEFLDELGIARNILSQRLAKLVAEGIFEKTASSAEGHRHEYRLTKKGRDLWVVLAALRLWGDKWIYGPGKEPIVFEDPSGHACTGLAPVGADGRVLDPRGLVPKVGPGGS